MRVCLIQCGGGEIGKPDAPAAATYNIGEPLGLLCLDAELRRLGHDVLLLHPCIELARVLTENDIVEQAIAFLPDLIGYSAMTNQVPATSRVALTIKSRLPLVPSVIGGDHFSSYPADLQHYEEFDFAVCGEGEGVLPWLLENAPLWAAEYPSQPAGVYRMSGGRVLGSGRAQRLREINHLPFPSRYPGLLRSSAVGMIMWPPPSQQTGMISLNASRGCPYACSYCNARLIWGSGVSWREPRHVVEELRRAKETFGVNTAMFVDLTFNADLEKVYALCDTLTVANLGISWYVLARPGNPQDRIRVDRPLLEAMRQAGCVKIGFGVETVSPKIARELRRAKGGEYVHQLARWMDELGMISKAFLIMGHEAENAAYYEYLYSYLEELNVDEVRISFLTPFPGTPLWDAHRDELPGSEAYDTFTTFRPILPHPNFTSSELRQIREDILGRYYSSRRYLNRLAEKAERHPHLTESFDKFLQTVSAELSSTSRKRNTPEYWAGRP